MFELHEVVPWGRSLDEYRRMFALDERQLRSRILGCADGPASFNAELRVQGGAVTSCDPLYRFSADEIRRRIDDTARQMLDQAARSAGMFVWCKKSSFADLGALARHRRTTMDRFLLDYEAGRLQGRYVAAALPELPFDADSYDIAVCSHFLFLYSRRLTRRFHIEAVRSLSRVAGDVRVFPLTDLRGRLSSHLAAVSEAVRADGLRVAVETVPYEFLRGANQMMRITR